jgi:hypothetical protein
MTYTCPTWESASDLYVLKLQCLQNKALLYYFPRFPPVLNLHIALKIAYLYDFITKVCRKQAEVIQNYENPNVHNIRQGDPQHKGLKLSPQILFCL